MLEPSPTFSEWRDISERRNQMKITKIISQFLLGSDGHGGAVIQSVVQYDTGYIGVLFTTTDSNGEPSQTTPFVPALKNKARDYYIEVPADKLEEATNATNP